MKHVQKLLSSALACAMTLSFVLPLGASAGKSFTDVKGHWASTHIKNAVSRGYVDGYQNGAFKPNSSVTRAEFCKMLNNAIGLNNSVSISFSDVSSRDWFYAEVAKSVSAGYIAGYEDGSFRANAKISRQEAAVVISRIVSEPSGEKSLSELRDGNGIDAWAQGGAKTVYSKGYMRGDNHKKFNPKGKLTRGEAVKIIESIIGSEKISRSSTTSISAGQTSSDTVYTGNVKVSSSSTFRNCSILGTLQVSGKGTVRLQDTKVSNLTLGSNASKAEIIASGKSNIKSSSLSVGASLTESGLYGEGFRKVDLSGTKLSAQSVNLTGAFQMVTVSSRSNLYLESGSIKRLKLKSNASGSKIDLAYRSSVEKAEISGNGEFTGRGIIYYAMLNSAGYTFETAPQKIEGKTDLTPTISPKNGAKNVATNNSIQLTFPETLYTSACKTLTRTYVEDSVIELRRSRVSGTKQDFTASISSNNRVITIRPDEMESGTKYYVIVKAALKDSSGQSNEIMSVSFTTGSGPVATIYPVNGSDGIPVNTPIKLTFPERMYQENGSSLSRSYLEDSVLELRSDSATGRRVSFSADITDRKIIDIRPDRILETNTKYYLIVQEDSIANDSHDTLAEQIYAFTTANTDILVPTMLPSPGSTEVAVNSELELSFDRKLYTSSGSRVTESYLEDNVFTLRRDSTRGSVTAVNAEIDSARKVVTLKPDRDLRYDTIYYLIMDSKSLSDSSSSGRNYNEKLVLSFNTTEEDSREELEPIPSPRTGAKGVSMSGNITLSFDTAVYQSNSSKSRVTSSYLENSVLELRSGSDSGSRQSFDADISSNRKTITINPDSSLSANKKYYVIVKSRSLKNSSGEKNSKYTTYFTCGNSGGLLSPEVTPSNGASGVDLKPTISLDFDEALYNSSSGVLSNNTTSRNYLEKSALQLRVGSESGSTVRFTVDSVSSNKRIRLSPDSTLENGNTYFLILREGKLENSHGQSNSRQVYRFTVGSGLTVRTTPRTGATGVDRTAPIKLYFSDRLYNASNGDRLSSANVNSVLKNYIRLTASGVSAPRFNVELSSDGKTVTVRPTAPLEANRTYTLRLYANCVRNYSGNKNSSLSVSFTSRATVLQPIVSPTNGRSNVSTTPQISLRFAETLYTPAGIPLKADDVQNVIELREGSNGTIVRFNANVSSNKIITVSPTKELANSTRYYITLKGDALASSRAATVKNAAQSFYFTTIAPSYLHAPTLSISAAGNDGKHDIRLTFSTNVYKAGKTALDEAYLLNKIKLSTDSAGASTVALDRAEVSGRTITLTTASCLTPGENYYISAVSGVFSDTSGNKNQALNLPRQAPELAVNLGVESITKDSASLQVTFNYPIFLSLSGISGLPQDFRPNARPYLRALSGLANGTTYTVTLSYYLVGDDPSTAKDISKIFTTQSVSTNNDLTAVHVMDAYGEYIRFNGGEKTADLAVEPKEGKVTLQVVAEDEKASVEVSVGGTTQNATCEIPIIGDTSITITVTAENGATEIYTLKLTLAS